MKRSRIVVPDAEALSVEISSGTDVSGTDVSGTDVSGTDVPSTDVSRTDVSRTDVSDPEDSGRDISDKEICGSASSVRSKICPCREYSRALRQTFIR